ncbi:MAG: protein kinase [Actinomycetota bacterium]
MTDNSTLEPGQLIGGRWRIDRFLASGGFGRVFAATDQSSADIGQVAVKVLLEGASTAERQSFLTEARHMSSLRHPNLVSHIDSGLLSDGQGGVFLVIDLCEESLDDYADRQPGGVIPEGELPAILADVSAGLSYLHRSSRVHRDLKPANILRAGDRWKLADFGLVRDLSQSGVYHIENLVGTPRYMAPEFFTQGSIGPAVDIWAIGVIVHELVTGHGVHSGEGPAYIHALTNTPPAIAATLQPGTANLVSRCLTTDPGYRPQADELPGLLAGTPTTGPAAAAGAAGAAGATLPAGSIPQPPPSSGGGIRYQPAGSHVPPMAPPGTPSVPTAPEPAGGGAAFAAAGTDPLAATQAAPATTAGLADTDGGSRRWWLLAVSAVALVALLGAGAAVLLGDDDVAADDPGSETVGAGSDTAVGDDTGGDGVAADQGDGGDDDGAGSDEEAAAPTATTVQEMRSDVPLNEFRAGDCVDITDVEAFVIDSIGPCDEPHLGQVLAVFESPDAGGAFPGDAALLNGAVVLCLEAFQSTYGVDQGQTSLAVVSFNPTEDDWNDNIFSQVCMIWRRDFELLVEPVDDIEPWLLQPGDSLSVIELEEGICYDAPVELTDGFGQRVVVADCAEPHDGEQYATVLLTPAADGGWPGRDAMAAEANSACHDELHALYGPDHDDFGFTSRALIQLEAEFVNSGSLLGVCVADFGTERLSGTLEELAAS